MGLMWAFGNKNTSKNVSSPALHFRLHVTLSVCSLLKVFLCSVVQLSSHFSMFPCISVHVCACVFLPQCVAKCARRGGDRVSAAVREPGCSAQLRLWQRARGTSPDRGCPSWANQAWALVDGSAHAFHRVQRCVTDPLMDSNMFSTVSAALCWSLVCVCSDNEGDSVRLMKSRRPPSLHLCW